MERCPSVFAVVLQYLAPVSTTPAVNFPTCSAGVFDTGGKFVTAGVIDTLRNLPAVSITPAVNLPPVSMTPVANGKNHKSEKF
jgi:hypothetical protein